MVNVNDLQLCRCLNQSSFWQPDYMESSGWFEHAPFAFWLMSVLRPAIFVELGTHWGFSYFAFCQAVKALKLSTQCYAVDTWKGDQHAGFYSIDVFDQVSAYNKSKYKNFSKLIQGTFENSVSLFPDGSIDILHIDGRHFYDDVRNDFYTWRLKLSSRSIVLFHDTAVKNSDFGVHQLWQELTRLHPNFEFQHGHGLGVLGYGVELNAAMRDFFAAAEDESERSSIHQAYSRLGSFVAAEYESQLRKTEIQELRVKNLGLASSHHDLQVSVGDLEKRIKDRELEARTDKRRRVKLAAEIELMKATISWRITAPFRSKVVRHLRRAVIHARRGRFRRADPKRRDQS